MPVFETRIFFNISVKCTTVRYNNKVCEISHFISHSTLYSHLFTLQTGQQKKIFPAVPVNKLL